MINSSYKVLVVDDEPDVETLILQKFRRKIREHAYSFVFARDGRRALELIERDPDIDIVLTDINMPEMDGLTLLSSLSTLDRLLKIVVVSAYGDMRNIRTAMNRGAYDFLTKPIDFQDFERTLEKTIQEIVLRREGQKARELLTSLQQELSIAMRIQQSMLPRPLTPFPGRDDFEVYAEMIPARLVGGDFYDFFTLDSHRLAFVIGDVSGKGVPAALFMAVTRTLLRATAMQGLPAGDCLTYLNSMLKRQCEESMFVTIFYGILDTRSGELEYSMGGHLPPYRLSPHVTTSQLDSIGGTLVGAFDSITFETGHSLFCPGDALFLYTDGLSEAEDHLGNVYSDDRLRAALDRLRADPAERIIRELLRDVNEFSGGASQLDDITAMVLRWGSTSGLSAVKSPGSPA